MERSHGRMRYRLRRRGLGLRPPVADETDGLVRPHGTCERIHHLTQQRGGRSAHLVPRRFAQSTGHRNSQRPTTGDDSGTGGVIGARAVTAWPIVMAGPPGIAPRRRLPLSQQHRCRDGLTAR
jgi:hypothetical protein